MKSLSVRLLIFEVLLCISSLPANSIMEAQTDLKLTPKVEVLSELMQLPTSDKLSQKIYLLRHGESTANRYFEVNGKKVRYVSGNSPDIPLTEVGKKQILKLAEKLAERFPKQASLMIVSSSALRTKQTTKILFDELSKTHCDVKLGDESYQGLNERSLGKWEGRLRDENYMNAEAAWRSMSAADKFISPEVDGGESYSQVASRALAAIAEISHQYSDSTVIAVTSFNTINAVRIQINNIQSFLSTIPGTNLPKLDLGNGDLLLLETPRNCALEKPQVISHIQHDKKTKEN